MVAPSEKKMSDAKTKAAQALDPLLSSFRVIEDQALRAVWYKKECDILDQIVLQFDQLSLAIRVNGADEIDFEAIPLPDIKKLNYIDASILNPWHAFIGKKFGWGWITTNQQGYCDGLLLGFESIIPGLIFNVAASEIMIGKIEMQPPQV
jgi:hypothetical protein